MTTIGSSMLGVTNTYALKLLQGAETPATVGTKPRASENPSSPATLLDGAGSSDVSEFIYDAFGKFSTAPDLDDVIGLPPPSAEQIADPTASNHPSKVKFEIKIGDVVLARIYEGGVAELADGFDYSSIGFDTEEAGLEGMALAQDRTARILKFFAELTFDVTAFGPDGAPVVPAPEVESPINEGEADGPDMSANKLLLSLMLEADRFQSAVEVRKDSPSKDQVDRTHVPENMTEEDVAALSDSEYLSLLKGTIAGMIDDWYAHLRSISMQEPYIYSPVVTAVSESAG